jgi:RNA exonuclease 1
VFGFLTVTIGLTAEREQEKTPMRYLLTLEQMIENDYPVPSYMADAFEKPEGWFETPEPSDDIANARILAIDCEMVCLQSDGHWNRYLFPIVSNRRW